MSRGDLPSQTAPVHLAYPEIGQTEQNKKSDEEGQQEKLPESHFISVSNCQHDNVLRLSSAEARQTRK